MTLFGHGQVMSVTNPVVASARFLDESMDHTDPLKRKSQPRCLPKKIQVYGLPGVIVMMM